MLVVTKLYNKSFEGYKSVIEFTDNYKRLLISCKTSVDVWDTDKNDYYVRKCNVYDLRDNIDNIFGICRSYNWSYIEIFEVSKKLWDFLDITDGFIPITKKELPKQVNDLPKKDVQLFSVNNDKYCVVYLDEYNFMKDTPCFFCNTKEYKYGLDIIGFYTLVFDKINGNVMQFKEIFVSINNAYYKMSMSEEIALFIIKNKVMG
jgi:hypothetical protein